jgi:hypothetical protein
VVWCHDLDASFLYVGHVSWMGVKTKRTIPRFFDCRIRYRKDECVNKNGYYLLLDGWLFCVSIYNLLCAVVIMLLLCFHVNGRCRKCIIIPLHVMNLCLNVGGIVLIVRNLWIAITFLTFDRYAIFGLR